MGMQWDWVYVFPQQTIIASFQKRLFLFLPSGNFRHPTCPGSPRFTFHVSRSALSSNGAFWRSSSETWYNSALSPTSYDESGGSGSRDGEDGGNHQKCPTTFMVLHGYLGVFMDIGGYS